METRHVILLALLLGAMCVPRSNAQSVELVQVEFRATNLADALVELSQASGRNIVFSPDVVRMHVIDLSMTGTVQGILNQLLRSTGLAFRIRGNQYIVFAPRDPIEMSVVSGYIEDVQSGARLGDAHIYDTESGVGSTTNEFGFFSLALPGNSAQLRASYLGYISETIEIATSRNVPVTIALRRFHQLDSVTIYGRREDIEQASFDPMLPVSGFGSTVSLGGELDIQQLAIREPGVTTGTDGVGGINIRGGDNDQNLVLMDGVPVYNPTHAIGILSIFNPLLVKEVELRKSEFPARYSGRLSSVLDVRTREGSERKWAFRGSIGPLSVNAMIEGPLLKDKLSMLASARRFVPGFYLRELAKREKDREGLEGFTKYAFKDFNGKLKWIASPRDRLYLSFYHGLDDYYDRTERFTSHDIFELDEEFEKELQWGNTVGSIRWNHQFSERLFANATLTRSKFDLSSVNHDAFEQRYPVVTVSGWATREFKSSIEDLGLRWDFDMQMGRSRARFGAFAIYHQFRPKGIAFNDQSQVIDFITDEGTLDDGLFTDLHIDAWESGAYWEQHLRFGENIRANLGLHLSMFEVRGYWYAIPQPRLHLEAQLSNKLMWESNATFMVQFLHLLRSSGIGLPTDLWVSSTENLEPQQSFQASSGLIFRPNQQFFLAGELYVKHMRNLTEYREGASFLLQEGPLEVSIVDAANWEEKVTQGTGDAYGVELRSGYHSPALTAQLSYTHAHSTRQFDDINFGNRFPFRFDRRHTLSTDLTIRLSGVVSLTAGWTFGSGAPITLAQSQFKYPGSSPDFPPVVIIDFGERNAYRLPSYHRLDAGIAAEWVGENVTHGLQLNVYNAYNRRNTLYVTLVEDVETGEFENVQFTVLPLIPSLSYHISF